MLAPVLPSRLLASPISPPLLPLASRPVRPFIQVTAPRLECQVLSRNSRLFSPTIEKPSAPSRSPAWLPTRLLALDTAPPTLPSESRPVLPFIQVAAPASAAEPLFHEALRTSRSPLGNTSMPDCSMPL